MTNEKFKSGFVGIIGRPNVGKSTLLNNILGKKVAIMSPKPQTTRNQITGIYTKDQSQLIFIDTPGIHKPKNALGDFMVQTALNTLRNVDLILYVVAVDQPMGTGDLFVMEQLKKVKSPVILVLNKADLIPKESLLPLIQQFQETFNFKEIIPISALKGENVQHLLDVILSSAEEGPLYYPQDTLTDQPEKQIISEIIREKILLYTEEEVPHSVAVTVDYIQEEGDLVKVFGSIYVERDSQKGIIIGKGGRKLKGIGKEARLELEGLWGMKVYLDLRVKVKEMWRRKDIHLRNFGYEDRKS